VVPDDVVPIESLAPAKTPAGGLEVSFQTLGRLQREGAPVSASFSALLPASPAGETSEEPVAITSLLYSGQAALERAEAVRRQISAELGRNASMVTLQPLLEELLDLVPLALAKA
jgi:hypothetical protein